MHYNIFTPFLLLFTRLSEIFSFYVISYLLQVTYTNLHSLMCHFLLTCITVLNCVNIIFIFTLLYFSFDLLYVFNSLDLHFRLAILNPFQTKVSLKGLIILPVFLYTQCFCLKTSVILSYPTVRDRKRRTQSPESVTRLLLKPRNIYKLNLSQGGIFRNKPIQE